MSDSREPRLNGYLDHMLEAISLVRSYVDGFSRADFLADKRTQQAVILNIVVIGEAATRLADEYPEFVAGYPEVPWKSMRGMRNRMAHGYFDIDLAIVWQTVHTSLPELAARQSLDRDSRSGRRQRRPIARFRLRLTTKSRRSVKTTLSCRPTHANALPLGQRA